MEHNEHNGKLYIETVGCQMNVLDSELVVAALRQQGYELCSSPQDADTVLFNTCSVRELAEHKTYSSVGRLKHGREKRPQQVIGLIGCMAQKDQNLIFQKAPHVDLVVGTGQLAEIPKLVDEVRRTRKKQLAVSLGRRDGSRDEVAGSFESYDPLRDPSMRPSPWQAYVRIMIGCDKFCTYCVVPTTRGPEQSRPPRDILREVESLAAQGVREITLLGQTVNSYKHTQDGQLFRMSDLLRLIHDVDGILPLEHAAHVERPGRFVPEGDGDRVGGAGFDRGPAFVEHGDVDGLDPVAGVETDEEGGVIEGGEGEAAAGGRIIADVPDADDRPALGRGARGQGEGNQQNQGEPEGQGHGNLVNEPGTDDGGERRV